MPAFVLGGAIGRFFGEVIAYNFPDGVRGDQSMLVYPGVYAVVGEQSSPFYLCFFLLTFVFENFHTKKKL